MGVGREQDRSGGAGVLRQVDDVIRDQGMQPTEEIRAMLAAAAEQRMRDRGEEFSIAVRRAMALLAVTARAGR